MLRRTALAARVNAAQGVLQQARGCGWVREAAGRGTMPVRNWVDVREEAGRTVVDVREEAGRRVAVSMSARIHVVDYVTRGGERLSGGIHGDISVGQRLA